MVSALFNRLDQKLGVLGFYLEFLGYLVIKVPMKTYPRGKEPNNRPSSRPEKNMITQSSQLRLIRALQ